MATNWSSLRWHLQPPRLPLMQPGLVPRPGHWSQQVNLPQTEAEVEALRRCAAREAPFGEAPWVQQTALALGLELTLHSLGRPAGSRPAAGRNLAERTLFDGPTGP